MGCKALIRAKKRKFVSILLAIILIEMLYFLVIYGLKDEKKLRQGIFIDRLSMVFNVPSQIGGNPWGIMGGVKLRQGVMKWRV